MHAGYPIMGHTPTASIMVSVKNSTTGDFWGPLNQLGHNQQRLCWEFKPHTTDCTCNLWSVYAHEEVLGVSRAKVGFPSRAITIAGCSQVSFIVMYC